MVIIGRCTMRINVELDDRDVRAALEALTHAGSDLRPALEQIGEYLIMSIRDRFQASVAPDGTPWAPNTQATYLQFLGRFKGSYTKRGKLSKAGGQRAAGKKPLIGETGSLSSQISWQMDGNNGVQIGSPMQYAAAQQFGMPRGYAGTDRRGRPLPWGDIPARPFLGVSDQDADGILDILEEHLLSD